MPNPIFRINVALVGDAAHTVHPMAGQGLNLGLDDVQALVDCILRSYKSGMDITTFLQDYNTTQRLEKYRKNQWHSCTPSNVWQIIRQSCSMARVWECMPSIMWDRFDDN